MRLFLLLFLPTFLLAEDWKLRALKYNNPGLSVDLGVGLWAWPMPMDFDNDGDYDLLVSCPDKPSNGIYFFENPTQDPTVKLPTFKPGVHIARTNHNTQVSYVDGKARILRENYEFVDFRDNNFSKKEKIYPTNRLEGLNKTRARMWRYVDWEGDGDQDLIAGIGDWSDYVWDHAYDAQGRWQNGPLHGWIYLIKNEPNGYSNTPVKVEAGGSPVDVYGWPSPNFADFDSDGDLDLLCGEFLDGFTYFQNTGTRSKPKYAAGIKLRGSDHNPLVMYVQMITPTALDWDRDGDIDLIIGDEDGRVAFIENLTPKKASTPVFAQPVYFQQEADTLKFGALSTPFAHDWDQDGDEDILCGNTAGNIALFKNLDGKGNKWAAPKLLEADGKTFRVLAGENGSIQGPAEAKWGYTTLSVADWDGDGRHDILYNSIRPEIKILRNTAEGLREEPLNRKIKTQWRTTPLATDFDKDGKLDLVILDHEGYLTCNSARIFLDENLKPIRLNSQTAGRSGRAKIAVVDWDGDGRNDILTNSENATWWRNCESAGNGKVILKKIGNLAKRNVAGHTSSPTVCDFDKNGKPDLIVGAENGRLYFIKHENCLSYPPEALKANPPAKVPPPRFPGLLSEDFIFTKAPHLSCHASTIAETSRGLVVAWFGGTHEKHKDVGIWSSYNDGKGWSKGVEWANGIQHADLRYPTWNPVLYQPTGDAPLSLFFKVGPNPQTWWGEVMTSYDRGRSFRDRKRLPEGINGPVRSKPLLLADGTLLCPSSTEHGGNWRFHFERLKNNNWKRVEPKKQDFQVIQPSLLTHTDGCVQALYRSKHKAIMQNFSKDGGITWTPLEKSGLPNNNAGIEALTLNDGRHLLLYNHLTRGRQAIHLAISKDGKSWHSAAIIEKADKGEFSYPAMIQTKDGKVHLTYTWHRKRVRHLVIDPAKLKRGPALSNAPWPE